jgi:uncharacterized membrane protein
MSHPRKTWTLSIVFLAVIILIAAAPILVAVSASLIADFNGCEVSMGKRTPCIIAGSDWGPTLLNWSLAPWFLFYTVPLGVLLLVGWLIVFLIRWSQSRSKSPS